MVDVDVDIGLSLVLGVDTWTCVATSLVNGSSESPDADDVRIVFAGEPKILLVLEKVDEVLVEVDALGFDIQADNPRNFSM